MRDSFAATLLRFFQQFFWYFNRNFPRRIHDSAASRCSCPENDNQSNASPIGSFHVHAVYSRTAFGAFLANCTSRIFNNLFAFNKAPQFDSPASTIFPLVDTYHRGNLATDSGADCFMGPNDMTPASKVMLGIPAQTAYVRSNEEGVLAHPMKDLRDVRLRLR